MLSESSLSKRVVGTSEVCAEKRESSTAVRVRWYAVKVRLFRHWSAAAGEET